MNFFPRSDFSKLQATVTLYTISFMKNKPHHENQREKLNNICENQPNLRTPGNTPFLRLGFFLTFTLKVRTAKKTKILYILDSGILNYDPGLSKDFNIHLSPISKI